MQKYEQSRKIPEQHHTQVLFGVFSIFSQLNRYLRSIPQGIHQAVIVVDGNFIDHSVPKLFLKLNGRSFKLGRLKEHTADGNRLGISLLTLCREAFELFLFAHGGGGALHNRLPYHFGEDIHLPLASLNPCCEWCHN